MATYEEHIFQAKKNLEFLQSINLHCNEAWDWQTTVCFYSALHLINAHIVSKTNNHYRSHEQVNNAINPYKISPSKLNEDVYTTYIKLQWLSRRSRYLISEDTANKDSSAFFTSDKHFAKATRLLDRLLIFFSSQYKIEFKQLQLKCPRLYEDKLSFFKS